MLFFLSFITVNFLQALQSTLYTSYIAVSCKPHTHSHYSLARRNSSLIFFSFFFFGVVDFSTFSFPCECNADILDNWYFIISHIRTGTSVIVYIIIIIHLKLSALMLLQIRDSSLFCCDDELRSISYV